MEYIRNCPDCNNEIKCSNKYNAKQAEKLKRSCKACAKAKEKVRRNLPEVRAANSKRMRELVDSGQYDKSHLQKPKSEEHKTKIAETVSKVNPKGKDSFLYGKSSYQLLVDKYGKEEADTRFVDTKKKRSAASSGRNNPMYGKPAPSGSGNGWKGWYKGYFFRSLRELFYMVNVLEKENLSWINAESRKFSIPYISFDGNERTYRADFLVENRRLVECKPIKLHNSPLTKLKAAAAEKFCQEKGWSYELIDPPALSRTEIKSLYDAGHIKFMDNYERKYKQYLQDSNHDCGIAKII